MAKQTNNNEIQNKTEGKELFKEELKKKAMEKLAEAIKLNKENYLSKESREAKAEACALILMAMRTEVQFDPNDPMFQIFVQKQSWRNAMKRACKEVCNTGTDLCRKTIEVLKSINLIVNPGGLVEGIVNMFSKHGVKPLESAEVVNEDNWSDFYEDIPKDGGNGGNGPSFKHNSETMEMYQSHKKASGNIQTFLSSRSIGSTQPSKKITNQEFYNFLRKQLMNSSRKTQSNNLFKSSSKKTTNTHRLVALSRKENASNAA